MAIGRIPEPGTGIPESIIAAKGDLLTGTANDTPAVLTVGANGTTLVADSSTATGLVWKVDPVADLVTTAGDTIYATAADTLVRLGIGTAGQVLQVNSGATAPEWATPAGGGANWSLLNAGGTALTGAATITVSGISAKDKVMIIVAGGSSASAGADFYWRLNADSTANYNFFGGRNAWSASYSSGNACQARNLTGANEITWGTMAGAATSAVSGYLQISGCNASGVKMFHGANGVSGAANQTAETNQIGGWYAGTSTISSISVVSSVGNFDAGTVYVYTSA
jgi:hypothetical protein